MITMKKQNNLTENIKVRMTLAEKQAVVSLARANGTSISSLIRDSVLGTNNTDENVLKIRCIMEKNKICNHIVTMSLPKDNKEQILKEVSSLD